MPSLTDIKGYIVQNHIGNGAFGDVYQATRPVIGGDVAIKVIKSEHANQPDFIRRFESEAQLIAHLDHIHIVQLYDYWRDPDGAYLVMRWLKGGNLKELLQNSPLEIDMTRLILEQIAAALAHAHRHGVIHRDLKPANILFDEDGNAYLADFGIAKDLSQPDQHTATGSFLGTVGYSAPEQIRGETVSPRTDVYSLGVILYEMLVGEHPYPNLNSVEKIYKSLNDPVPLITTLDAQIQDGINEIIQKATAKDPLHRYAGPIEMATAFREEVTGLPLPTPQSVVEALTPREQEILLLLIQNKSNREIATTLFLTVGTVKWNLSNIYKKLGVRNRVQAIVKAKELNLIVSDPQQGDNPMVDHIATYLASLDVENPYKGLRAFKLADEKDFYGRTKLTNKLLKRLAEDVPYQRFLAVLGPSGSGKSSLVQAGLLPAILRQQPAEEAWYIVDFLPGQHPLDKLETALTRVAADQGTNIHEHLQRDERGLLRIADLILPDDDKTELLIVIDQFEEVFTLVEDEADRAHFLNLLVAAVTELRSRVRIIITLRADFYDRPLQYPEFGIMLRERMETILPLTAEELEAAITQPAAKLGVSFEAGLVSAIVSDINYQPGALPLLQYALTELFDRRTGRAISRATYDDIGGTIGALAKRADEIFEEFGDEGQALTRQIFMRLVTLGEGTEDTRRRVSRYELQDLSTNTELVDEIIDTYVSYRLLALDHDPTTRVPTVEVAHEAILREWELLRTWLNDSREDIKTQRLLANQAQSWIDNNKDNSYLLRGRRLERFETWFEQTELSLTPVEQEFIKQSSVQHQQEEQRETERQVHQARLEKRIVRVSQGLAAVFLIAAVVSGGFGIYALQQQREIADQQRKTKAALGETEAALDTARRSSLAFAANSEMQINEIDLALALAMESVGDDDGDILDETSGILETLADQAGPVVQLNAVPWCGRMISGNSLDDSIWLVGECNSDTMYTYDSVRHEPIASAPFASIATSATSFAGFSPDNQFFAMAISPWFEDSIEIGIWQTSDMSQVSTFVIDRPIASLRWAWDSSTLATIDISPEDLPLAKEQGIEIGSGVSFWDIESGELIRQLDIDAPYYHSLNFSHDGSLGIVGGWSSFEDDKQYQVTVFDTATGETLYQFERPAVFHPENDPFGAGELGFNPDDTIIWFGGYPGYAITLATGETYGHMHEFVPEANRAPNEDAYVRYASSPHELLLGERSSNPDPNFEYLTSLGANDYRIFNVHTGDVIDYGTFAYMAPTTMPNKFMASYYGRTQTFYLWDIKGRDDLIATIPAEGSFPIASYSPDGRYLAIVGAPYGQPSGSVSTIYYADTLELAHRLDTEFNLPYDLAWSPDGRYLATTATVEIVDATHNYQNVILWDPETGEEVRRFAYSEEKIPMTMVEFTPDGRYLVTGKHSRINKTEGMPYLLMFDVETGELVKRIDLPAVSDPNYGVHWLTMHPTRNLVYVTINSDLLISGNVRDAIDYDRFASYLVDLDTEEVRRIPNDFIAYNAEFTPDGNQLIFSAIDGNLVWIYDIETQRFVNDWESDQAGISALDISMDGQTLITPSSMLASAPIINLWDVDTGETIRSYTGHDPETFLLKAEFQPDGERFISTAVDGTVRVWRVNRQSAIDWIRENRFIRPFTCTEREIYRIEPLCNEQD